MVSNWALQAAAHAWSTKATQRIRINPTLLAAFADVLDTVRHQPDSIWRHPLTDPGPELVPEYGEGWFVVTVKRATGKTVTFTAWFLKGKALHFEDGCGLCEDEDTCSAVEGNGCPVTGWYVMETNPDYEEYYTRMLYAGDEFLGWTELPKWTGLTDYSGVRYDFAMLDEHSNVDSERFRKFMSSDWGAEPDDQGEMV